MLKILPHNAGSLYCVGRNYAAHAKELNNPVPSEPVIFTKTRACLCPLSDDIVLPQALGRCDHETEIVVRIDKALYRADNHSAKSAISHFGLALDMTLREKQTQLKQQKYPWDLAKSFINACPITPLQPLNDTPLDNIEFSLSVNGELRQQGNSKDMLFDIVSLISFISQTIPLQPGDLILTGTPEGVGPLHHGDRLSLTLGDKQIAQANIVRE